MSDFRSPTNYERKIFDRLTEGEFDGQAEIIEQLKNCLVSPIDDHPIPCLKIKTTCTTPAITKSSVPTEAWGIDSDGSKIEFLLHVKTGFVSTLEIVTYKDTEILSPPTPENLELFQPYSKKFGVPR